MVSRAEPPVNRVAVSTSFAGNEREAVSVRALGGDVERELTEEERRTEACRAFLRARSTRAGSL